jgi:hypothetical protein
VWCSTLYGGNLQENPDIDTLVSFVDAEGSGGLTSEDYDVKLIAGPMLLARVIMFNVADGLHVSDRCLRRPLISLTLHFSDLQAGYKGCSAAWTLRFLRVHEQEREILSKLAVMTKVGKQLIQRQGTQKPFGCLHVVFQQSREEELLEPRYSQLFDLETDVLDEEVTERNNIRQELVACFEVSAAIRSLTRMTTDPCLLISTVQRRQMPAAAYANDILSCHFLRCAAGCHPESCSPVCLPHGAGHSVPSHSEMRAFPEANAVRPAHGAGAAALQAAGQSATSRDR